MNIALVSYINTRPFADGLSDFFAATDCTLHLLPPSECAESLKQKKVEMALMPVGALLEFSNIRLLPNFCIGAQGAVNSVFIFSRCPIEEIDTLLLDRHSRSSNGLARVLMRHFWKKEVNEIPATEKHFDQIQGKTAGVVIGDKALKIKEQFEFVYDLSECWYQMTGMGFAFAVWAYYPDAFTEAQLSNITQALTQGVANRSQTAEKWAEYYGFTVEKARNYLLNDIHYEFSYDRQEAVELYLKLLQGL